MAASAIFATGAGGQTDTDFYRYAGEPISITIHLDRIGLQARAGADAASVNDLIASFGLTPDTVIDGRLYVATLQQAATRPALVSLARSISVAGQLSLHRAGLVTELGGWSGLAFVTDEFIAQFRPEVARSVVETMNLVHGVEIVREPQLTANNFVLRATSMSVRDAIELSQIYDASPLTEFAQPDFVYRPEPLTARSERLAPAMAASVPTPPPGKTVDPLLGEQWHLHNDGTRIGTPDADIDAPEAWTIETGNPNTLVALIEFYGYEPTHKDLQPNIWVNPGEIAGDGMDNGDPFLKPDDVSGWDFYGCPGPADCGSPDVTNASDLFHEAHANASTGLVAAVGDNGEGVKGVCPRCSILPITLGWTSSGIADAIEYAWGMGADILNMSLHTPYDTGIRKAVQVAADQGRGGLGTLIVWSACYPYNGDCSTLCSAGTHRVEALDSVMTVTWTSPDDRGVDFVSFPRINGDCLDVAAPGDFIATTDNSGFDGYNAEHKPIYPSVQCGEVLAAQDYTLCYRGTSAAAPIVAGVAGLVVSRNPALRWWEVKEIIENTADMIDLSNADPVGKWIDTDGDLAVDFSNWYGHGRVNAYQALLRTPAGGDVVVTCEETGTCPDPCEEDPGSCPSRSAGWEFGARMGVTVIQTPNQRTVTNGPGGGPMGDPIFHATWFANPGPLMIEGQLGFSSTTEGTLEDRSLTLALQPAYQFSGGGSTPYLGFNVAFRDVDNAVTSGSDVALGFALGTRFFPKPFLSLRLEARYRYWFDKGLDEFGLAAGFGVLLN